MFIIWGTYGREVVKGRVADFCASCAEVRSFCFVEIRQVSHIYFIPLGSGTLVGEVIECEACTSRFVASPLQYREFVQDHGVALENLLARSNPQLHRRFAQGRGVLESAAAPSPEERRMRIQAPFRHLDPLIDQARHHWDLPVLLSLLAIFGFPLAWSKVDGLLPPSLTDAGVATAGLGILAGLVCLLYSMATRTGRFLRSEVIPKLVLQLAPVAPTVGELKDAIARLRSERCRLARRVQPEGLAAAIAVARPLSE